MLNDFCSRAYERTSMGKTRKKHNWKARQQAVTKIVGSEEKKVSDNRSFEYSVHAVLAVKKF